MRADRDKRAAILRAAAAENEERRAGALTIEAVARRAGVAKGTVYKHFASADELYRCLIDDGCAGDPCSKSGRFQKEIER